MLTSEELMRDGSYDNKGRRNEALDCRVYALAAADVHLKNEAEELRRVAENSGFPFRVYIDDTRYIDIRSKHETDKINKPLILDRMEHARRLKLAAPHLK